MEQIEEMTPMLLANALKSAIEREQQVIAAMLTMMGATKSPRR